MSEARKKHSYKRHSNETVDNASVEKNNCVNTTYEYDLSMSRLASAGSRDLPTGQERYRLESLMSREEIRRTVEIFTRVSLMPEQETGYTVYIVLSDLYLSGVRVKDWQDRLACQNCDLLMSEQETGQTV